VTTEDDIKSLFDRWNAALQTRDPEAVTALYSSDATLLPTISNEMRRNHAEIRDYFEGFLQRRPRGVVNQSNVRDFGDVAVHSGIYTFEMTMDGETSKVPCRFTFVYRNEGGEWKILEHHSSAMPE
jgi:uncharacterized protein (TIGR02246 family)